MQLTDEQFRIVRHQRGHARVSAVAGSGKTTTMIARIGHLLEKGENASEILVLMFNKSAKESFATSMGSQLDSMGKPLPEVRTFHALGLRLVDSFTRRGALPSFRLVTEDFVQERIAKQVVTEVYREQEEGGVYVPSDDIEEFLTFIDLVKSTVEPAAELFSSMGLGTRYSYFIKAYELFEVVRKKQRIRFFADLIHEPLMAMQKDRSLVDWVGNRVKHIIVDEYQDINEAQQLLLTILAGDRAQVMVVGDVDQCIYEWRGAKPEYITRRFQLDFENPANYLLSYTFRFGHRISLAANHLIHNNKIRDAKLCISHPSNFATTISHIEAVDGKQVVSELRSWKSDGRNLAEAVVLVRLYAQSVPVELALLEAGIPYRLEGNSQVFECSEILALTGYLKLVSGSICQDELTENEKTVYAMLSQPHLGLKREELKELAQNICSAPDKAVQLLMQQGGRELPPFIRKRCMETAENWQWMRDQSPFGDACQLLTKIVERLDLYKFYHKFSARTATAENRIKTCKAFIDFAAGQKLSIDALLEKISELAVVDGVVEDDTLLITSIHRAKGLEWPLVIIPGLDNGSFPFYKEQDSALESLEDERRLFYVAMTRAKEKLDCLHPPDRLLLKSIKKNRQTVPAGTVKASRFLYEANLGLSEQLGAIVSTGESGAQLKAEEISIAKQYLGVTGHEVELIATKEKKKKNKVEGVEEQFESILNMKEIRQGMDVYHAEFGCGKISAIMDSKQGRIKVVFEDFGEVILLMGYAKLRSHPPCGD